MRAEKLEALGMFASGIAHDFNNLLQAIDGHATLALAQLSPSLPVRENLEQVLQASARGAQLVRRILAFSRPEQHPPHAVELGAVVREVVGLLRATLPSFIALRTHGAQEALSVLASTLELHQVIMNLATNAAHAIGARPGQIEIETQAVDIDAKEGARLGLDPGPHVLLSVRDDGCGMTSVVREHIFDAFFSTKGRDQGTGLGRSVVQGIVTSAGGAADVETTEGVGTTFYIYLPRVEAAAWVRVQSEVPRGKGERVLYVDDDPMLVALGRSVLESTGYHVTAYAEPRQALEAFTARPHAFDIVITDVRMPQLSGFELTRQIHALEPAMPVLVMSGWVGQEERALAQEVGACEILLKPVGKAEFERALARNLHAPGP